MKDKKIFGVIRPSLIGDIIASTIFPCFLDKIYPDYTKIAYIDRKCSAVMPFLINHDYIDKILISEKSDELSVSELNLIDKSEVSLNPFPNITRPDYYNHHHITKELFLMNELYGDNKKIDPNVWDKLSEDDKKIRLTQWFDVDRKKKSIAIWPFSGYGANNSVSKNLRSPSSEWWIKLLNLLTDYKIYQFGHPLSEKIQHDNVMDCRSLSLFDSIKLSIGCDVSISTDSGPSWILGGYGAPQIVLYTNYQNNHFQNFDAMVPVNHKNNLISLFGLNGIENINQENVVEQIKKYDN